MLIELIEIVDFVHKAVPKAKDHLSILIHKDKDILNLYDVFIKNAPKTEEDVIKAAGFTDKRTFKKVSKSLFEALSKLTVLVDGESLGFDLSRSLSYENNRTSAASYILGIYGAKNAAAMIGESVLQSSMLDEKPRHLFDPLLMVMQKCATVVGDAQAFAKYNDLMKESLRSFMLEREMVAANMAFYLHSFKRKNERGIENFDINALLDREEEVLQSRSFHCQYAYYALLCAYYFSIPDYNAALRCTKVALGLFASKPYNADAVIGVFAYLQTLGYTMMKQFEAGEESALKALAIETEGTDSWYNNLEVYFFLCTHSRRYEKALEIYQKALNNRRFVTLRPISQEMWTILGAYLYIVHAVGRLHINKSSILKFKATKFINEMPQFIQDKSGMNAAILIAHTLLLFVEGKTDILYERIQALDKYSNRYLRDSNTVRSRLFIKMLTLLPKTHFRKGEFIRKTGRLIVEIQQSPIQLSQQAHELEVIPYDDLYEMLLEVLPEHRRFNALIHTT